MKTVNTNRLVQVAALLSALALVTGCETVKNITGKGSSSDAAPATASDKTPAPSAKASGNTQHVKGINDTEGDIVGTPAAGSRFTRLKIGMGLRQVTDLIGQPTDQGAYITGKSFIPFYFGGDRYRHEMAYKSMGRLVFAGGSAGDHSASRLIEIVNDATEDGYR